MDKSTPSHPSTYQVPIKESKPRLGTIQAVNMQSKQLRRSFPSKSTVNSSVSHNVDSKENVEYYNGDTFGKNEWAKSTFEIRAKRNMKKSQSVDPTHKEYNSDTRQRYRYIFNNSELLR